MAKRFSDPDAELALKVKETGDNEAMKKILDPHSGVYLMKIERSLPDCFPEKQQMIEDRLYKMWEYTRDFDPNKNMKLSTYIGQRAMWECLNIFNRSRQTEELDNTLEFSYEQEFENLNQEMLAEIFLLAENYGDSRARKILELRFNSQKPMPWKKIAANLGLNTNTVINIHKKFLSAAKRNLKKYEIDSCQPAQPNLK